MENKKVFNFLRTFSKRQLNRFEDYLNSPYFNKSEELCFIYEVVKKYISSSSQKSFAEYLKKYQPTNKKPISTTNLDKYLSRIFQFVLDFVGMEKLKEKAFLKSSLLMEYLIEGDELSMFDKIYMKTKKVLEKEKLSNQNLYDKFALEKQKANYLSTYDTERKGKQNLQEFSDTLDQFYLTQKYDVEILKIARQNVIQLNYNYYLIDKLNYILKDSKKPYNELFQLQNQVYNLIDSNEQISLSSLNNFCQNLLIISNQLEEHIAYNMGQFLRNNVRKAFQSKDEAYYKYCFKLNNKLLDKGLLHYKGNIFAPTFKNVIDEGLRINKLEWCNEFVDNNNSKIIPEKIRPDIANYARARIKFFAGDLEEARDFIRTLKFKDIIYKFALKRLEIMIYYELEEYLILDSLIGSFRVSLTPNRFLLLKKDKKDVNNRFANYVNKLLKIKQSSLKTKAKSLNSLLTEINADTIVDQFWFEKKIQEAIEYCTS